jgi:hypothetical protein
MSRDEKSQYRAACPRHIKQAITDAVDAGFMEGRGNEEGSEANRKNRLSGKAAKERAICLVGKELLKLRNELTKS